MGTPDNEENVTDSPTGWVLKHVREYVESDGNKGARKWGSPSLLITTRGRRTGTLRRTALFYGTDGGRYLVVPSNGGAAKPPAWYLNLLDDPKVRIQVGDEKFDAVARVASAAEKPSLWKVMTAIYPTYDAYQARTKRDIPVVIIERADG